MKVTEEQAGNYKSVGISVTHDQILITTGGSEAIMFGFYPSESR